MKKTFGPQTLIFPTPVWCVGTYDSKGAPNVMTIAWGGICCSQPPCVNIALRKATYTYGNILEKKAFTLNVPSEEYAAQADYFGMVSGKDTDKFNRTGLTPLKSKHVDAPIVEEFPLNLECRLIHNLEIGLHTLFVGEIMEVSVDQALLDEDDNPDLQKIKPFIFAPSGKGYYGIGEFVTSAFDAGKKYLAK